jgi:hypothetical protein
MAHSKKPVAKRRAAGLRNDRKRLRDGWHLAFDTVLERFGSPAYELIFELVITVEPQRADVLLLRRRRRRAGKAKVLRRLWGWLGKAALLEFKSPVDGSFKPGDLLRLVGYGIQYHTNNMAELAGPADLTLVLVLPVVTPTLEDELRRMSWTLESLDGGYSRIHGAPYATLVVAIDEACEAEKDEYLALFSRTSKVSAPPLRNRTGPLRNRTGRSASRTGPLRVARMVGGAAIEEASPRR